MRYQPRCILLQVISTHYHQDVALRNMRELEQLVDTYGGRVIEKAVQHRVHPDSNTYIGSGKLEWLQERIIAEKVDVVILNAIVNSGQLFRLEKALWKVNPRIKVWDRVDLILSIFEKHATTAEGKLQIELARMQHIGPRVYGLGGGELSRQGGGIGTRGLGETNSERERRTIKRVQQKIHKQLKELAKSKVARIKERQEKGVKTIALVGYTSAGKTTLFNVLTQKNKVTDQALFTTLDSTLGRLKVSQYDPAILISDTIGFIDELPPILIEAFKSTLLESIQARVLVHVVDASDVHHQDKIGVVNEILKSLQVVTEPIIVFNKIDLLSESELEKLKKLYQSQNSFFISAKEREGILDLKQTIHQRIYQ